MTRDDLKCVVDQACVSNAAGPDYLWPGLPLEPRLWEALRIEMQSRYRRSTGETMAVLRVDLSEEACRTCDGTGKEGCHSLCRECDDHQPPLVRDAADKIDRLGAPAPEYHVLCRWLPIAQADRTINHVTEFTEIGLTLKNSDTFWVRDEDGRTYQAAWSEGNKGRDYWWDWEAESPVDPVEFMPHPLDPRWVATTETN